MDTTLYDLAEEIRLNAIAGLDADREPDRSYVSTGVPAHDFGLRHNQCDGILAVHVRGIRNLSEGQPTEICAFQPAVDMSITIVRCATAWMGTEAPSTEVLAQESSDLMSDIWQVFTHLTDLWANKQLFDCQAECRQVRFGRMQPSGPLGGAAAWVLDLTIVDPYTCDEGS
jgi:hypothetical protein